MSHAVPRRMLIMAMLGGCAAETPRVDPVAVAPHEWDHGPPWSPAEEPWVEPPLWAFAPAPGAWGYGGGIGLGFGGYRGFWWRGGRHGGRPFGGGMHFRGHRGRR